MRSEPPRSVSVSCLCGADLRVNPRSADRRVTCRQCGMTVDFVVTMDPAHNVPRLSIVVPRDAVRSEGESLQSAQPLSPPPPPPPARSVPPPARAVPRSSGKTIRGVQATCSCGTTFPVDDSELASIQDCPSCKRSYHVVVKIEAGTKKKTAILVPQKPIVHRDEIIRTMVYRRPADAAPAPAAAVPAEPTFVPGRKSRTRVASPRNSVAPAPAARPKPPPEVPPGAQAVPCTCGEMLIVRRRDLDQGMTCTGCGQAVRFKENCHPQTLARSIRVVPPDPK